MQRVIFTTGYPLTMYVYSVRRVQCTKVMYHTLCMPSYDRFCTTKPLCKCVQVCASVCNCAHVDGAAAIMRCQSAHRERTHTYHGIPIPGPARPGPAQPGPARTVPYLLLAREIQHTHTRCAVPHGSGHVHCTARSITKSWIRLCIATSYAFEVKKQP